MNRIDKARSLLMLEAREQNKRGDMQTHHILMFAVDALDDAKNSAASYQFIKDRVEHQHDDLPDRARDRQRERLRLVKGEEAEAEERRKIGER